MSIVWPTYNPNEFIRDTEGHSLWDSYKNVHDNFIKLADECGVDCDIYNDVKDRTDVVLKFKSNKQRRRFYKKLRGED